MSRSGADCPTPEHTGRGGGNLPIGEWHFVEIFYQLNTAPGVHDGWTDMRVNNELIYRANNVDLFGGDDPDDNFAFFRFGGNYGFDDSGEAYYRQYGHLYIDGSHSRVALCEAEQYEDCRHVELQVPTSWSDDAVTFTLNPGTFGSGERTYVYVLDEDSLPQGPAVLTLD